MSNCFDPDQNLLSDLIWVQTVCKGYQQTTKAAASKEGVNVGPVIWVPLLGFMVLRNECNIKVIISQHLIRVCKVALD